MEQAIDELEQQSMQTRTEDGQIREHMGKMREQLNKVSRYYTGGRRNAGNSSISPRFFPAIWNASRLEHTRQGTSGRRTRSSRSKPPSTLDGKLASLLLPSRLPGQTGATCRTLETTPVHDEKISSLEQRVRIIEGTRGHSLDATDLCLMSDVALPMDFKTPKFEKYKGSSCPQAHLAMYCRKMAAYIHQDKILVHCFQDSLTWAALNWYINLEKGQVRTWRDLAETFVRQYRYNKDMALDRS
ncbi:hypothetical protein CR513_36871, partial [Mucuna pruriens]